MSEPHHDLMEAADQPMVFLGLTLALAPLLPRSPTSRLMSMVGNRRVPTHAPSPVVVELDQLVWNRALNSH